jgi:hypothetical protein
MPEGPEQILEAASAEMEKAREVTSRLKKRREEQKKDEELSGSPASSETIPKPETEVAPISAAAPEEISPHANEVPTGVPREQKKSKYKSKKEQRDFSVRNIEDENEFLASEDGSGNEKSFYSRVLEAKSIPELLELINETIKKNKEHSGENFLYSSIQKLEKIIDELKDEKEAQRALGRGISYSEYFPQIEPDPGITGQTMSLFRQSIKNKMVERGWKDRNGKIPVRKNITEVAANVENPLPKEVKTEVPISSQNNPTIKQPERFPQEIESIPVKSAEELKSQYGVMEYFDTLYDSIEDIKKLKDLRSNAEVYKAAWEKSLPNYRDPLAIEQAEKRIALLGERIEYCDRRIEELKEAKRKGKEKVPKFEAAKDKKNKEEKAAEKIEKEIKQLGLEEFIGAAGAAEFAKLSAGQRLQALDVYKQKLYERVSTEAYQSHQKHVDEGKAKGGLKGFFTKDWRNSWKTGRVISWEKQILKRIEEKPSDEDKSFKNKTFGEVMEAINEGLLGGSAELAGKNGEEYVVKFSSGEIEKTADADTVEKFNAAAGEFSKLPLEGELGHFYGVTAQSKRLGKISPRQKEYVKKKEAYEDGKKDLINQLSDRYLAEKTDENEKKPEDERLNEEEIEIYAERRALLEMQKIDSQVKLAQDTIAHPEAESNLRALEQKFSISTTARQFFAPIIDHKTGKVSFNSMLFAGGGGIRMGSKYLGIASGGASIAVAAVLGGAVGGVRGWQQAHKTLDENEHNMRRGLGKGSAELEKNKKLQQAVKERDEVHNSRKYNKWVAELDQVNNEMSRMHDERGLIHHEYQEAEQQHALAVRRAELDKRYSDDVTDSEAVLRQAEKRWRDAEVAIEKSESRRKSIEKKMSDVDNEVTDKINKITSKNFVSAVSEVDYVVENDVGGRKKLENKKQQRGLTSRIEELDRLLSTGYKDFTADPRNLNLLEARIARKKDIHLYDEEKGTLHLSEDELNAQFSEEEYKLMRKEWAESLESRVYFTRTKLGEGLVNFGKEEDRLRNELNMMQALGKAEATMTAEFLSGEFVPREHFIDNTGKQKTGLRMHLDAFMESQRGNVKERQRKYVRNEAIQAAALGALFAGAGAKVMPEIWEGAKDRFHDVTSWFDQELHTQNVYNHLTGIAGAEATHQELAHSAGQHLAPALPHAHDGSALANKNYDPSHLPKAPAPSAPITPDQAPHPADVAPVAPTAPLEHAELPQPPAEKFVTEVAKNQRQSRESILEHYLRNTYKLSPHDANTRAHDIIRNTFSGHDEPAFHKGDAFRIYDDGNLDHIGNIHLDSPSHSGLPFDKVPTDETTWENLTQNHAGSVDHPIKIDDSAQRALERILHDQHAASSLGFSGDPGDPHYAAEMNTWSKAAENRIINDHPWLRTIVTHDGNHLSVVRAQNGKWIVSVDKGTGHLTPHIPKHLHGMYAEKNSLSPTEIHDELLKNRLPEVAPNPNVINGNPAEHLAQHSPQPQQTPNTPQPEAVPLPLVSPEVVADQNSMMYMNQELNSYSSPMVLRDNSDVLHVWQDIVSFTDKSGEVNPVWKNMNPESQSRFWYGLIKHMTEGGKNDPNYWKDLGIKTGDPFNIPPGKITGLDSLIDAHTLGSPADSIEESLSGLISRAKDLANSSLSAGKYDDVASKLYKPANLNLFVSTAKKMMANGTQKFDMSTVNQIFASMRGDAQFQK